MNEAETLGRIADAVAVDSDPALTVDELLGIFARARRPDEAGNPPTNRAAVVSAWAATTAYAYGDVIYDAGSLRFWQCTTPGVSGSSEPDWPDIYATSPARYNVHETDGPVWTDIGTEWSPTYSVAAAAVEGWELKAGKVAERFAFTSDGQAFQRQQLLAHCERMARKYRRRLGRLG